MKSPHRIIKTIVILSVRQIEPILSFIKNNNKFRFILIHCDQEAKVINQLNAEHYFQRICQVNANNGSILTTYDLNETASIISQELEQVTNEELIIVTQDESNTIIAAQLRDKFNLYGPRESVIEKFRNKDAMKQAIKKSGLRTPKSALYCGEDYKDLAIEFGLPFIVKPTESAGSDGVHKIESGSDFEIFLNERYSNNEEFELQEFIAGRLYHIDTVIMNQQVYFSYACEYLNPMLNFQYGYANGSKILQGNLSQRLIDFSLKCIKALGYPDGCQHTEVFVNESDEIIFLESAARAPGLAIKDMYELSLGISPATLELNLLTNINHNKNFTEGVKQYCFWAELPMVEGYVQSLNPPPLYSQCDIKWLVNKGEYLKKSKSNLDIAAHLLIKGDSELYIQHDFETMRSFRGLTTNSNFQN